MKRLVLIVLAGLALAAGPAAVSPASASWACVSVDPADFVACLRNPLPEESPVPEAPAP